MIDNLAAFFSFSSSNLLLSVKIDLIQMEITLRICEREERKNWKVVYDERSAHLGNIEGRRMEDLVDFIDK